MHDTNYQLAAQHEQERFDEWEMGLGSTVLHRELQLARFLAEKAAREGNDAMARDFLKVVATLAASNRAEEIRLSQYVNKKACSALGREFGKIVLDVIRDLPDFEARIDRLIPLFEDAIRNLKNDSNEIKHLK